MHQSVADKVIVAIVTRILPINSLAVILVFLLPETFNCLASYINKLVRHSIIFNCLGTPGTSM